jgi:hypothetical protein
MISIKRMDFLYTACLMNHSLTAIVGLGGSRFFRQLTQQRSHVTRWLPSRRLAGFPIGIERVNKRVWAGHGLQMHHISSNIIRIPPLLCVTQPALKHERLMTVVFALHEPWIQS